MKTVSSETLSALQHTPECIRNICILAHVDHGKTSLADALVAKNGIISSRMAGKLRYMDSREDEQKRGITMKSSGISLGFASPSLGKEFLINLIDTPGHVDFSSEVSTAVRLCDGALVVIDVVEGVCPQTFVVLKQAWQENIRPVLVLNKIDRLIVEVKMSPLEAYRHIHKVLTDVNAATGELFTSDVLRKKGEEEKERKEKESGKGSSVAAAAMEETDKESISFDCTSIFDQVDDSNLYFSPDQGNVIFASAIDGWGFGLDQFVDLYSKKLGVNAQVLRKTLWGDFFLNAKAKKIQKGAAIKAKKPLFVQLVLENLWSVYDAILVKRDKCLTEKITSSLNLKILPRDSRSSDPRVHLQAICSQWLPLADAALDMVCRVLPSPLEMSTEKIQRLIAGSTKRFEEFPKEIKQLTTHFAACSHSHDVPTIAFISKVFAIDTSSLPSNKRVPLTQSEMESRRAEARKLHSEKMRRLQENANDDVESVLNSIGEVKLKDKDEETKDEFAFIAFARVYSGSLRKGDHLYVLGPKHDSVAALDVMQREGGDHTLKSSSFLQIDDALPSSSRFGAHVSVGVVSDVFLLMGRDLELVDEAPAGNIVGIAGLEDKVLRSATLASTPVCPPFTDLWTGNSKPIVRVAIEPQNPSDVDSLIKGMKMLNQADPCVQVILQETGEHVLITAGEVHLERCVKDLKESFAKIPLNISPPIVPFRETIVTPPKVDRVNELIFNQSDRVCQETSESKPDFLTILTPNKEASLKIKLSPIPKPILKVMEANPSSLKLLTKSTSLLEPDLWKPTEKTAVISLYRDLLSAANDVSSTDDNNVNNADDHVNTWKDWIKNVISLGPKKVGCNLLVNKVPGHEKRPSIWPKWVTKDENCAEEDCATTTTNIFLPENNNSIVSGFQLATNCGPICHEPLLGVAVILLDWRHHDHHEGFVEVDEEDDNAPHQETITTTGTGGGVATSHGPMSGQLMSAMKEGIVRAFNLHPRRLMVAMYSCEIQATADVLGRMYAVLSKRQGRVESEELREGSNVFLIDAILPVVESFGFCDEVRKRTSGLASPQLVFSHWEVFDLDPFWVPTTEEEILHFGDKADSDNIARKYMNDVRRRKGLKVEEKIVEFAEKQRTLTKNK